MGQTLTHGIYLPDEGERNCYNGLAGNWQLLDGAVGTVAEHTSQIAGKAPAVHTHGKADITDLFNSVNMWTGDNTYAATINYQSSYTLGNPPQSVASQIAVKVTDAAGSNYLTQIATYQDTALSGLRFTIRDKFDSNGFSPSGNNRNKYLSFLQNTSNQGYLQWDGYANNSIIPLANNTYDLGSSSYQWNNLYAKNYYYNGTEFQSKFVTADTVQTVNGVKTFTAYVGSIGSSTGDEYSSNARTNLWLMGNRDTEEVSGILFDTYRQNTAQGTGIHILGIGIKENSVRYEGCRWGWYWDNNLNGYTFDFKPTTQGANQALKHNLGTSVDKWNTLNGINPGALSLPNLSYDNSNKWIDISGNITDETGAQTNLYQPTADGWIIIAAENNPTYLRVLVYAPVPSVKQFIASDSGTLSPEGMMFVSCPVPAGARAFISFNKGTGNLVSAKFILCQGDVI